MIRRKHQCMFVVKKCSVCGETNVYWCNMKEYQWIFKGKFCCSYTCYRKLEKPYIEKYKNKIGMGDKL